MKIVLRADVDNLSNKGDQVEVPLTIEVVPQ